MMTAPVSAHRYGKAINEITGLEHVLSFRVEFDINHAVVATVKFYLDEKQAESVLTLFDDGKWRTPTDV